MICVTLSCGKTSAMTWDSSIPTARATCRAASGLSPVSSHGSSPKRLSSAMACAEDSFGVSATVSTARGTSATLSSTGVAPVARAWVNAWARTSGSSLTSAGRPTRTRLPSTVPTTPRPAWFSKSVTGGSSCVPAPRTIALATAAARRKASCWEMVSSAVTTPAKVITPVVTVPVLSMTMVSTFFVDSRISGPLMSRPSWAPRPVPTSSAVGVASPSAHGQAMINTATAAVKAGARPSSLKK